MKTKTILAAALVAAAVFCVGASNKANGPFTVGGNYTISNGAAAVKGQVLAEVGGGWVRVKRTDGRETLVNVANAFFIEETK